MFIIIIAINLDIEMLCFLVHCGSDNGHGPVQLIQCLLSRAAYDAGPRTAAGGVVHAARGGCRLQDWSGHC